MIITFRQRTNGEREKVAHYILQSKGRTYSPVPLLGKNTNTKQGHMYIYVRASHVAFTSRQASACVSFYRSIAVFSYAVPSRRSVYTHFSSSNCFTAMHLVLILQSASWIGVGS